MTFVAFDKALKLQTPVSDLPVAICGVNYLDAAFCILIPRHGPPQMISNINLASLKSYQNYYKLFQMPFSLTKITELIKH